MVKTFCLILHPACSFQVPIKLPLSYLQCLQPQRTSFLPAQRRGPCSLGATHFFIDPSSFAVPRICCAKGRGFPSMSCPVHIWDSPCMHAVPVHAPGAITQQGHQPGIADGSPSLAGRVIMKTHQHSSARRVSSHSHGRRGSGRSHRSSRRSRGSRTASRWRTHLCLQQSREQELPQTPPLPIASPCPGPSALTPRAGDGAGIPLM